MRYFLLTTRGLEDIARAEVQERLPAAALRETAYRRVALEAPPAAAPALLELRCADDVFGEAADWTGIGKAQSTLERLAALAATVDLRPALELCATLRPVARPVRFAVSASFVGRRNYTTPQIKLALADGVTRRYGWAYVAEEVADGLSLRLFIEHERALLGVRLGAQPLHRRPYKQHTIPGSLKPPVAAALARLAGAAPGVTLLDPLCGVGTIVIEAALLGAQTFGGDNDPAALALARANLAASGASATLRAWDATALPLERASIDGAAANLPFGRQVLAGAELRDLYAGCLTELARVLRPGGAALLLTSQSDTLATALERQPAFATLARREISLYGQTPTVWQLERRA